MERAFLGIYKLEIFPIKKKYWKWEFCKACLHCRHRKSGKYYTYLQKKKSKYCTNFADVYKICHFLCVYSINLHYKYNVYIKILWKCYNVYVNSL